MTSNNTYDMKQIIRNAIDISQGDKVTKSEFSRIYRFTNEYLDRYLSYLQNRTNMLSVIGSGDQIFNAILSGTKEVDAFDINEFAKYYFYLKKAAIEVLTREEFIEMFVESMRYESRLNFETYFGKIFYHLDPNTGRFWKDLFKVHDKNWQKLYNSFLFNRASKSQAVSVNKYLSKEYYKRLQGLVKDVNINIRTGDILSLADTYNKEYNLIYLSNIWFYADAHSYSKMLEKLKLSRNGVLLAYSFYIGYEDSFQGDFEVHTLSDDVSRDSLIVYNG